MEMIDASGIDEDGDGELSKEEFLHFLRGMFLADIPSTEVEALRVAYDEAVADAPDAPMDEARVETLFKDLGFDMKSSNMGDVIGVIDADGDGDVDFDEFLTGIGMMKKMYLLSKQLDTAFSSYKHQSKAAKESKRRASEAESKASALGPRQLFASGMARASKANVMKFAQKSQSSRLLNVEPDDEEEEGVELDASDLMAFLNISRGEAEEMVFLADQDEVEVERVEAVLDLTGHNWNCHRSIDREEFQQLMRTWS